VQDQLQGLNFLHPEAHNGIFNHFGPHTKRFVTSFPPEIKSSKEKIDRITTMFREAGITMTYAESCKHGKSAPKDLLESLPENQGKTGRHKCVVCAYQAGIKEGKRLARAQAENANRSKAASSAS
jgi:hypothetical protein